ncbi:hypothetical protein MSAN_00871300 [Mycena sanguinolenta]|uniref:Uncharacterized protein n=1 Tax=Mycena sanguinolenta TaxID=230812 RepID=A0A8H6YZB3_9AGAR|nr:hypothetical protein MSAN_00871300 [Mycena sanguinolenta]
MSTISLLDVNLAVAVLESQLYGVYLLLASYTLYLMITRHRECRRVSHASYKGPRSKSPFLSPVALGAFTVFVTVTTHWLLNIIRLYTAFHDCQDGCQGPQQFYSDHSQTTEVLKCGFMVASVSIGDSLIIHRLWAVWAFQTRIIIVPSITLAALTTFGVGLTYQLSTYSSNDSIFQGAFRRWCTGICFFSMSTSIYTTGCIWYKLWDTNRALMDMASGYRSLRVSPYNYKDFSRQCRNTHPLGSLPRRGIRKRLKSPISCHRLHPGYNRNIEPPDPDPFTLGSYR